MLDRILGHDLKSPRVASFWVPIFVLGLGTGSILILVAGTWIQERYLTDGVQRLLAVEGTKTEVAIAHLWVEELVSGDDVDLEEIDRSLGTAKRLTQELVDELQDRSRDWLLTRADLASTTALASAAQISLDEFVGLSGQRLDGFVRGQEVGIGSAIDVQYDAVFRALLVDLRSLETIFSERLDVAKTRSRGLVQTIVLSWLFIVGLSVTGLWTRERRSRDAEQALRDSEAQLLRAQKMEAVGRLAGGIAHDINNHLAAITTQCEVILLKASADDPIRSRMSAIVGTAEKSSALIKRLLAFSRRQPVQPSVVNLNQVIAGLERMITGLIGEDIRLRAKLAKSPWKVLMDPSQLEQVVLNLVLNARDAMPTGGDIFISTENRSLVHSIELGDSHAAPGDYVALTVQDTGTGISPENRERIFEPFFTTKHETMHSGLGLATVHGVVQQNEGHLGIESTSTKGTSFLILLPRTHIEGSEEPDSFEDEIVPAATRSRILLVEDNEELLLSTKEILELLGYVVSTANNAKTAIEVFRKQAVNLLITDVVLPGMSGKLMVDQLRLEANDLKVLFISGYTDDVILRHGIKEGQVEFLSKPFSASSLATKIEQLLDLGPS